VDEFARAGERPEQTEQSGPRRHRRQRQDHWQRQSDAAGPTWSNDGHQFECGRTPARQTAARGTDAIAKTTGCHW